VRRSHGADAPVLEMTTAGADRTRYYGVVRTDVSYMVSVPISALLILLLIILGATHPNGAGIVVLVLGLIGLPIVAHGLYILVRQTLLPVVLDQDSLRIPYARKTQVVALTDIAGVGLLYRVPSSGRYPEGWYAHVWDTAGHLYPIRKAVVAATRADRYPPGQPIRKKAGGLLWYRDWSLPLTHEDPWELAESRPGEIAKDIYRRVLDVQGSDGAAEHASPTEVD
jgi:hypothetical protein